MLQWCDIPAELDVQVLGVRVEDDSLEGDGVHNLESCSVVEGLLLGTDRFVSDSTEEIEVVYFDCHTCAISTDRNFDSSHLDDLSIPLGLEANLTAGPSEGQQFREHVNAVILVLLDDVGQGEVFARADPVVFFRLIPVYRLVIALTVNFEVVLIDADPSDGVNVAGIECSGHSRKARFFAVEDPEHLNFVEVGVWAEDQLRLVDFVHDLEALLGSKEQNLTATSFADLDGASKRLVAKKHSQRPSEIAHGGCEGTLNGSLPVEHRCEHDLILVSGLDDSLVEDELVARDFLLK